MDSLICQGQFQRNLFSWMVNQRKTAKLVGGGCCFSTQNKPQQKDGQSGNEPGRKSIMEEMIGVEDVKVQVDWESKENRQIVKEIENLKNQLNQSSQNADKYQIRYLRHKIQKLNLKMVQNPLSLFKDLFALIKKLCENVDFWNELRYMTKSIRILLLNYKDKVFMWKEEKAVFCKSIDDIQTILKKNEQQNYDFGL